MKEVCSNPSPPPFFTLDLVNRTHGDASICEWFDSPFQKALDAHNRASRIRGAP
ncbi:hypothetical protein QJS10_CPA01g02506 [Acorus calamus]|uniref:Uncharacterized protein n=1 Tax=Acorus calamus TaxID=4465 RepID=A0AAV9FMD2_ACOCL|nr:hypothetical protein QJS10_CPA01g02506 [Acorus calamus]